MTELFRVIHEDLELLAINKPAGLVCHPTKTGADSSLIGRVRLYLGPAARPHLINRLDRETSGVVLVAKTDATARELRRIWETRQVRKEYLAIVHGHVAENEGFIDAPLGKDEQSRVAIKDCVRPDGLPSQTRFRVVRRFRHELPAETVSARDDSFTLLRVEPLTGRKHQIRIHLAHLGHPVVGDKLYGGDEGLYLAFVLGRLDAEQRGRLILANQALHAAAVRFVRQNEAMEYVCDPEPWFDEFVGFVADGR